MRLFRLRFLQALPKLTPAILDALERRLDQEERASLADFARLCLEPRVFRMLDARTGQWNVLP